MRLCYVLLSPTWGMHQYTAGLANRLAGPGHGGQPAEVHAEPVEAHLVTTRHAPRDRYAPEITIHTPIDTRDAGFSADGLRQGPAILRRVPAAIRELRPDVVHITGPHLWNPWLLGALGRAGIPTVHTLHDLHPHAGAAYGRLLYLWNRRVWRRAGQTLVHGQRYRDELVARGLPPSRVRCTPLTHLFAGYDAERALRHSPPAVRYEPWALFIGRLLPYKGLEVLVEAARNLDPVGTSVVIAGPGRLAGPLWGGVPANVEVRNYLILDEEAIDLFRRCGLVVLPYVEASQSALVAAAHFFKKPVIATRVGALPEYVQEGETGWLVAPGDPQALARALQGALADPDRLACLGRAGHAWYLGQRQAEATTLRELYAAAIMRAASMRGASMRAAGA